MSEGMVKVVMRGGPHDGLELEVYSSLASLDSFLVVTPTAINLPDSDEDAMAGSTTRYKRTTELIDSRIAYEPA